MRSGALGQRAGSQRPQRPQPEATWKRESAKARAKGGRRRQVESAVCRLGEEARGGGRLETFTVLAG